MIAFPGGIYRHLLSFLFVPKHVLSVGSMTGSLRFTPLGFSLLGVFISGLLHTDPSVSCFVSTDMASLGSLLGSHLPSWCFARSFV